VSQQQQDRVDRYLAAYAEGDTEALAGYFDEDIVWHVAGSHGLSGDYSGRPAVLDDLARAQDAAGGTLSLAPIEVVASDEHVALFVRVTGERLGKALDVELVEMFKVSPDGRWAEFWSMANDQSQVDEFWSDVEGGAAR